METSVGIDVGKHTLDVAVSGQRHLLRFANTPTGWGELIAVLASLGQPCIVLEATNRYHEGVTAALAEVGQSVTVANPLHTAAFRRSEASLAKTDALDARMLQRFAAQKRPAPSPRPDPTQRQVRDLVRTREDLVSLRTRLTLQAGDLPPSTTPRSWPRSPTRSPSWIARSRPSSRTRRTSLAWMPSSSPCPGSGRSAVPACSGTFRSSATWVGARSRRSAGWPHATRKVGGPCTGPRSGVDAARSAAVSISSPAERSSAGRGRRVVGRAMPRCGRGASRRDSR